MRWNNEWFPEKNEELFLAEIERTPPVPSDKPRADFWYKAGSKKAKEFNRADIILSMTHEASHTPKNVRDYHLLLCLGWVTF